MTAGRTKEASHPSRSTRLSESMGARQPRKLLMVTGAMWSSAGSGAGICPASRLGTFRVSRPDSSRASMSSSPPVIPPGRTSLGGCHHSSAGDAGRRATGSIPQTRNLLTSGRMSRVHRWGSNRSGEHSCQLQHTPKPLKTTRSPPRPTKQLPSCTTKGEHTSAPETATKAKGSSDAANKSSADAHSKSTVHAKK